MMYEMYGDEYLSDRDEEVIHYNKSIPRPQKTKLLTDNTYDPLAWK
jgi:hypothetical protein